MASIVEPIRELTVGKSFDVIVSGGGPAGIAAALSAARGGAKTCLIEAHGCLGGIWTSGLLGYVLDSRQKGGILQELFDKLDNHQARNNGIIFDTETMKLLLEQLCLEAGVYVRLHTRVAAAYRTESGDRIAAVVTESKSGREAWQAKVYIDTTGDGDLAAHAGCSFDYGEERTGVTQPMSLIAVVTADPPDSYASITSNTPARGIRLISEAERASFRLSYERSSIWHIRDRLYVMMANHEYGKSALNADDLTEATMHARKELHELVESLRGLNGIWSSLRLVNTAAQIGVREGRRVKGRYMVRVDDVVQGQRHHDAICRVHFPLDVHSPHPDEKTGLHRINDKFKTYREQMQAYDIPLRALIARDVDGLLMAGRCISGDFLAHSSYRVTGNAVAMGQAAGVLASVAVGKNLHPHEVAWRDVEAALGEVDETFRSAVKQ